MSPKIQAESLINSLIAIQSIYDRATNRVLLLRLGWPSSAPIWTELADLAESLAQGRENFGAVLKVLLGKREDGVEVDGGDQLKALQDVIDRLESSLLGPIERGPAADQFEQGRGSARDFSSFEQILSQETKPSLADAHRIDIDPTASRKSSITDAKALMQIAADGQRRTLAVIVKILEQPQKMPLKERDSLRASIAHQSFLSTSSNTSAETYVRDSIFAKPSQQLEARINAGRKNHARANSLHITSPVSPKQHDPFEEVLQMPSPTQYISNIPKLNGGGLSPDVSITGKTTGIHFRNPFQERPEQKAQRASTLAPIPVTELEVDPLFMLKSKSQPQPSNEVQSPMENFVPKRTRPVGLPFLPQHKEATKSSFDKPSKPVLITTPPIELPADPVPAFLSSPLSDGPIPRLNDLSLEPPKPLPPPTSIVNLPNPLQDTRSRAGDISREQSFSQFSPFSEPSYESSDSYFSVGSEADAVAISDLDTRPNSKSVSAVNVARKPLPTPPEAIPKIARQQGAFPHLKKGILPRPRPQLNRFQTSPALSPASRSDELRSEKSPPMTRSPPRSPKKSSLASSTGSSNATRSTVDSAPVRPSMHSSGLPRSSTESASSKHPIPSPSLPRSSTESSSAHTPMSLPLFSRFSAESVSTKPQLITAPVQTADTMNKSSPRKMVLSIASPINETEETLVQPSAWNEYLGFCTGAALAQMENPGAMIESRSVQADLRAHTVVNFLKCSQSKCAFQGHGPKDKVWESSGVRFRRDFLVKSHCKQKKARNAIFTYQCIFCALTRQKSPLFQGEDAFMSHLSTHRDQSVSHAILSRTKCVVGRRAEPEEPFDVNLTPLLPPSPQLQPSALAPDALHSNPVIR